MQIQFARTQTVRQRCGTCHPQISSRTIQQVIVQLTCVMVLCQTCPEQTSCPLMTVTGTDVKYTRREDFVQLTKIKKSETTMTATDK